MSFDLPDLGQQRLARDTVQLNPFTRHDDVEDALALLMSLRPAHLAQVIRQTRDADLSALFADVYAAGSGGTEGLSADQRRSLVTALGASLDAEQLARVHRRLDADDRALLRGVVADRQPQRLSRFETECARQDAALARHRLHPAASHRRTGADESFLAPGFDPAQPRHAAPVRGSAEDQRLRDEVLARRAAIDSGAQHLEAFAAGARSVLQEVVDIAHDAGTWVSRRVASLDGGDAPQAPVQPKSQLGAGYLRRGASLLPFSERETLLEFGLKTAVTMPVSLGRSATDLAFEGSSLDAARFGGQLVAGYAVGRVATAPLGLRTCAASPRMARVDASASRMQHVPPGAAFSVEVVRVGPRPGELPAVEGAPRRLGSGDALGRDGLPALRLPANASPSRPAWQPPEAPSATPASRAEVPPAPRVPTRAPLAPHPAAGWFSSRLPSATTMSTVPTGAPWFATPAWTAADVTTHPTVQRAVIDANRRGGAPEGGAAASAIAFCASVVPAHAAAAGTPPVLDMSDDAERAGPGALTPATPPSFESAHQANARFHELATAKDLVLLDLAKQIADLQSGKITRLPNQSTVLPKVRALLAQVSADPAHGDMHPVLTDTLRVYIEAAEPTFAERFQRSWGFNWLPKTLPADSLLLGRTMFRPREQNANGFGAGSDIGGSLYQDLKFHAEQIAGERLELREMDFTFRAPVFSKSYNATFLTAKPKLAADSLTLEGQFVSHTSVWDPKQAALSTAASGVMRFGRPVPTFEPMPLPTRTGPLDLQLDRVPTTRPAGVIWDMLPRPGHLEHGNLSFQELLNGVDLGTANVAQHHGEFIATKRIHLEVQAQVGPADRFTLYKVAQEFGADRGEGPRVVKVHFRGEARSPDGTVRPVVSGYAEWSGITAEGTGASLVNLPKPKPKPVP